MVFFPLALHYINTTKYSVFKLNSEIYARGSVDAYALVFVYIRVKFTYSCPCVWARVWVSAWVRVRACEPA